MYDTKYKFAADFDLILKYLIDYKLIFKYMNHTIAFMHGGGTSSTLSHKNLNELEDVLTYRKAPYLIILRCKIGYYWLMFIENIKKYKTIYKLFSLYYYVRKNVFSVI